MNAINIIHPYKYNGQWVFDDKSKELDKEPFVAGADTLIDMLTNNAKKCTIVFSEINFPDATEVIENENPGGDGKNGTFYSHSSLPQLWLCPALLKYFKFPPEKIYFQIKL